MPIYARLPRPHLPLCAVLLGLINGCGHAPSPATVTPPAPRVMARASNETVGDQAPRIGRITIGAFAPEAGAAVGISDLSIRDFNPPTYATYRASIRQCYGADLADMNYLGVGVADYDSRYAAFQSWLLSAKSYGDPTIAIEPNGPAGYACFRDSGEMRVLRAAFAAANDAGITVWVRFASESNLRFSPYSVYNDPVRIAAYRRSVLWFRHYMPGNVRLVFSPLINTVYLKDPRQLRTVVEMYQPGAYDRIGGTLYATSWLSPRPAFDWYYHFMRRMDTKTPFQICELGGTYPRSNEVKAFLIRVGRGDWPGVQRVNLFAGDLNPLAISQHGHFGYILPGASTSYISDLFSGTSTFAKASSDTSVQQLEELSSGWQSADMTLQGRIVRVSKDKHYILLQTDTVTDELGETATILPPRLKHLILEDTALDTDVQPGERIEATGWDSGTGTPLRTTQVKVQ